MRTFERYFRYNTSLDQIDKYVRLVLKTFDPDDDIENRRQPDRCERIDGGQRTHGKRERIE